MTLTRRHMLGCAAALTTIPRFSCRDQDGRGGSDDGQRWQSRASRRDDL